MKNKNMKKETKMKNKNMKKKQKKDMNKLHVQRKQITPETATERLKKKAPRTEI